jgi:DNA-binding CsgD family transcriptional regulator
MHCCSCPSRTSSGSGVPPASCEVRKLGERQRSEVWSQQGRDGASWGANRAGRAGDDGGCDGRICSRRALAGHDRARRRPSRRSHGAAARGPPRRRGRHLPQPARCAQLAREPTKASGPPDDLTEREVEVLRLIALGYTNAEIASHLYLSVRTTESHRAHIQQKIRRTSRAELVHYAPRARLHRSAPRTRRHPARRGTRASPMGVWRNYGCRGRQLVTRAERRPVAGAETASGSASHRA